MRELERFASQKNPPRVWGTGGLGVFEPLDSVNAHYFRERLPAFFLRTLHFSEWTPGCGILSWVLTGARAGIQIDLMAGRVRVRQFFYDSYGLQFDQPLEGELSATVTAKSPHRLMYDGVAELIVRTETLSITLDERLGLSVSVNGTLLISQPCLFDVVQHQLRFGKGVQAGGWLSAPPACSVRIAIDVASRHQRVRGFGGIASMPAFHMLSENGKEQWWNLLKEYNFLIQREYPPGTMLREDCSNWEDPETAMPHSYGDNFPNGETVDFSYNRRVFEMGGTTWFEFWMLPPWVKAEQREGCLCDAGELNVDQFCDAVMDYCEKSRQHAGAPPSIIGLQNERCQPASVLGVLVPELRRRLDAGGFGGVRLHMSNASNVGLAGEFLERFMADSEVWNRIDFPATNNYDGLDCFSVGLDEYGKKLGAFLRKSGRESSLATELCINRKRLQVDSYRLAFCMAHLYHQLLTCMNAEALCYCWLLLHTPQPSFGWTRTLFSVDLTRGGVPRAASHQLRALGAFSRRIPAGSRRVGCSSSLPDVLVSAYIADTHASTTPARTVVILNRGISPAEVLIDWPSDSGHPVGCEICSPYSENFSQPQRLTIKEDRTSLITLDPGEIATISFSGHTVISPSPNASSPL